MKACKTCGDTKPLTEFEKDKRNKDGRTWQCRECGRARHREYARRPEVKARRKKYMKEYSKREIRKNYQKKPQRKIYHQCMNKIAYLLKNRGKTSLPIGCTTEEFIEHIESQFEDGMSWENKGRWHIDHVIPCSRFDLTDPKELKMAFHYSNLQPLWGKDNLSKGSG